MRPVDQTILMEGGSGEAGNCWAACIASILECRLDWLPNFAAIEGPCQPGAGAVWFAEARHWLRHELDLDLKSFGIDADIPTPRAAFIDASDLPAFQQFVIGYGPSPRGDWGHAIVCDLDGLMVHDPHPSRSGIVGPIEGFDLIVAKADDYPICAWPEES